MTGLLLASLQFHSATPSRWPDIETLFGERGARVVEGYPIEPSKNVMPEPFLWTDTLKAFHQAGFVEVARRSKTRPILRYVLQQDA